MGHGQLGHIALHIDGRCVVVCQGREHGREALRGGQKNNENKHC